MIQLTTEVTVAATRTQYPAVSIADQFTHDLTKLGNGRKPYASPEAFGGHQATLQNNYLLGENTVTRTRLDISDGSRTAYIKRYAFLGIS